MIIRLVQFGSPMIQNQYRELCDQIHMSFDDFQLKLIEDTGYSYDELKTFWIWGKEVDDPDGELSLSEESVILDKYLIIHFDIDKKEILGMTTSDHECILHDHLCYDVIDD